MLVLTVMSLAMMVLLLMPWLTQAERDMLLVYDNAVCVVFLIDFGLNLRRAHPKRDYFIGQRGWLDLIGSIPTFGVFQLPRCCGSPGSVGWPGSCASCAARTRSPSSRTSSRTAASTPCSSPGCRRSSCSSRPACSIVQFESAAPEANIKTGGEGIWWAIVTITTVGYGDYYPVTMAGRMTATYVMAAGVGIIGALASILASILVPQPKAPEETPVEAQISTTVESELAGLRQELAALRQSLGAGGAGPAEPTA